MNNARKSYKSAVLYKVTPPFSSSNNLNSRYPIFLSRCKDYNSAASDITAQIRKYLKNPNWPPEESFSMQTGWCEDCVLFDKNGRLILHRTDREGWWILSFDSFGYNIPRD